MVVPTAWWHATCNMHAEPEVTVGIGAEDDCDFVPICDDDNPDVTEEIVEMRERGGSCVDVSRAAACHGDEGLRRAARPLTSASFRDSLLTPLGRNHRDFVAVAA
jgi:hypothetical protein